MSRFQDSGIRFDRPHAIYAPGEIVTGKIVFSLASPANVGAIIWKVSGVAETSWTEDSSTSDANGNSSTTTDRYGTKEIYFKIWNQLDDGGTGNGETTLAAGQHSYPFSVQLPVNIPCSFEHEYGHIRYTVKAVVGRAWKLDRKVLSIFTVKAPYDTNVQPSLIVSNEPNNVIREQFVRKFHWFFFKAGRMTINVTSRENKLLPEGTIKLIINYNISSTRVHITSIKLELVKKMTFYNSNKKYYQSKKKLAEEVLQRAEISIGPSNKVGETSLAATLPRLPPLNLEYCSIIDVEHALDLTVHVSGMHRKITRSYPVHL